MVAFLTGAIVTLALVEGAGACRPTPHDGGADGDMVVAGGPLVSAPRLPAGRHVILVPHSSQTTPVAVTAWTRLERLPWPDAVAIETFVLAHDRRYDPDGP